MARFVKGDVVVVPFPADSHIVLYRVGCLKTDKLNEVVQKVVETLRQ